MAITITLTIVIITVLVSIGAFSNQKIQNDLIFYPAVIKENNQFYRFFTYGFIHADFIHLAFNMISLWSFGKLLETETGGLPTCIGDRDAEDQT